MNITELNMNQDLNFGHKINDTNSEKYSEEEPEVLGTSGLYNMGNTCYMNSIVQCLSNCEEFRQYILSNNLIPDLTKNKEMNSHQLLANIETYLSFQLRKIIINIWNSSFYSFRPISFKKLFGKKIEMFQNSAQHDSQEALLCILDTFNDEIGDEIFIKSRNGSIAEDKFKYLLDQDNLTQEQTDYLIDLIKNNEEDYINYVSKENFLGFYKKKYSIICNIFGGRIISELKCPIKKISKVNFEPFFFLSLSIPNEEELDEEVGDIISSSSSKNTGKISFEDVDSEDEDENSNEGDSEDEEVGEKCNSDEEEENSDEGDSEDEEVGEKCNSDEEDENSDEGDSEDEESPIIKQAKQLTSSFDEDGYFDEENHSTSSTKSKSDGSDCESDDSDTDYLNLFKKKYSFSKSDHKKKLTEFNLDQCLDLYFKPEILDDENRWFSPYANQKVNAVKNIMLWESPNILIIHLKRFKKTMYGTAEKITNKINFPLEGLDISKYYHKSSKCKNNIYDLFAINNHTNFNKFGFNGISFGHYYSYCKNITNNKWYDYNDESVNEISLDKLITSDAYILFYKLRE